MSNMQRTDQYCIHGHWEDGICVCEQGYQTSFEDVTVYPRYCADDVVVVVGNEAYSGENLFHLTSMAGTVIVATYSFIALASLVFSFIMLLWTKRRVIESRQTLLLFEAQQLKRQGHEYMNAEVWTPLPEFQSVGQKEEEVEQLQIVQAKVLHDYKPQEKDELHLRPGDIISEVVELQQGWCKGNLNGKVGFFPAAFVKIIDEVSEDAVNTTISLHSKLDGTVQDVCLIQGHQDLTALSCQGEIDHAL